jgi:glycosyltransferase involved in cell wall biosynthesis
MTVSIFIQTLNEEVNLPVCLKSVSFSDDIVVLDSFSSDQTEEITRSAGARFYQRKYDGRAANQNWAVENIPFKYPWVYYSDADEVVTPDLRDEILRVVSDREREEVVYRLRYKNMFMGHWNKHSSMYPTWVPRLFRPECIRWDRGANPVPIITGKEGLLQGHFLHYSFNKGMAAWFEKHNKYSNFEAYETMKELQNGTLRWKDLLIGSAANRRQALKKLSFRLPARPLAKFMYMYFARGGCLDGVAGLHYCLLQSVYEYMITIKVRELTLRERGGAL